MWDFFWPTFDTEDDTAGACRTASHVAFFIAAVTTLIVCLKVFGNLKILPGIGASALLDAGIFLALGIFLRRCSRIAALLALGLYIVEQIYMIGQVGMRVSLVPILFTICFVNGVRGSFAYHEFRAEAKAREEGREFRKSRWPRVFLTLLFLAAAGGVAFFFLAHKKPVPRARVFSALRKPSLSAAAPAAPAPAETSGPPAPAPGKTVFHLKDGRTVTGKVVYEDETYYEVETLSGSEIVIKQDIKK